MISGAGVGDDENKNWQPRAVGKFWVEELTEEREMIFCTEMAVSEGWCGANKLVRQSSNHQLCCNSVSLRGCAFQEKG